MMSDPIVIERTIRERADIARKALLAHDAKRKVLEAELLAVQHVCPHENVEEWKHYDYGGGCDLHWLCKDCGLSRVR